MNVLPTKGEGLSLIGFRISSFREDPELFTVIVYDDKDSPIVIDGQIAFISKPEHISSLYRLFNRHLKSLGPPPTKIDLICDVSETLNIIRRKKRDNKAVILNCLNTIFDLLNAVNVCMPNEYKTVLYNLADHLTFNREFSGYINENSIDRELIMNAIMWCLGAVAVNSRVIC